MALTPEKAAEMRQILQQNVGTVPAASSAAPNDKTAQMRAIVNGSATAATPVTAKKKGGLKGLVQGIAKAPLKFVSGVAGVAGATSNLAGAGLSALTGNKEKARDLVVKAGDQLSRERDYGYLGKVRSYGITDEGERQSFGQNVKGTVGGALELGSYAIGGPASGTAAKTGLQALKTGLRGGLASIGKQAVETGVAGAASGALQSIGAEMQNKDSKVGDVLKSGLVGTAVGGVGGAVLGAVAPAVGKGLNALKKTSRTNVDEVVGKVLQGEKSDIGKAKEALKLIDLKGIKTYENLGSKLSEASKSLLKQQDEILDADTARHTLDALSETVKVGDESTQVNYINDALNDLEELYQKTNDPKGLLEIRALKKAATTDGLTSKEINNLARQYGSEYGSKAFSRTGEPLTSVNAVRYENTRSGLKDTVGRVGGQASRDIDAQISSVINTTKLIKTVEEKVNQIAQKVEKRTLVGKAFRGIGKLANLATGNAPKEFFKSLFLDGNIGNKQQNFLDIEAALGRRLKILDKLLNMSDQDVQKIINQKPAGLSGLANGTPGKSGNEMYGLAAGFTPEKDDKGEVKISFKPENAIIGLLGMSVAKKGMSKVHADDLATMSDFTDYLSGDYTPDLKNALQLERDARRIAEHYGFKLVKSSEGLAIEFGKQLEKRGFLAKSPR